MEVPHGKDIYVPVTMPFYEVFWFYEGKHMQFNWEKIKTFLSHIFTLKITAQFFEKNNIFYNLDY